MQTTAGLSMAAAVAGVFSIAACHILIAAATASLIVARRPLRLPPFWPPLLVFMLLTLGSLALSPDPAAGWPQIRKFYVFLLPVVVYSGVRGMGDVRWLFLGLAGATTLSGLVGMAQFSAKYQAAKAAGQPFYESYIANQISGFMSHWMTFSGQLMIALLLLAAFLFFSGRWRRLLPLSLAAGVVLSAALVLAFTRGMWGATAVGGLYLLWFWRRWALLLVPPLLALALWLGPEAIRSRVVSIFRPDDARQLYNAGTHRAVLRATGLRMIAAHPWFGVGPMQVERRFQDYYPPGAPRPTPGNWYYSHLHNVYIHYAAERGIPAAAALLWFLAKAVLDFLRALRRLPPGPGTERWILHGALAVIFAVAAGAWWELNLGDSEVLGIFLSVVACGYLAAESGKREGREVA